MIGHLLGFGVQWWRWLRRGPNVVSPTAWTPGTSVSISALGLISVSLSLTPTAATQTVSGLVPGRTYEVATNVSGISVLGGGVAVKVGGVQLPTLTATGTQTQTVVAGNDGTIQVVKVGLLGFIGQLTVNSVIEIR